jgi:hypothetical protein
MRADDHDQNHDRHAQEHADDAPNRSPEREGEDDGKRAHIERFAHQHGLEHAADGEIDGRQQNNDKDEWTKRVELDKRDEGGKRNPDNRSDIRDEVQKEDEQRPGGGEIDADQAHDDIAADAGQRAHPGLHRDVAAHALGNGVQNLACVLGSARIGKHRDDFLPHICAFHEQKADIGHNEEERHDEGLSGSKSCREPPGDIDLGKRLSDLLRLLGAEPLCEVANDCLQPRHIARPRSGDGVDLAEKNPDHEIKPEQHDGDAEQSREPLWDLKAPESQAREALDHCLQQVPDEDADGKWDQEGAPIDESGENDADRNDREACVAETFPAFRDFHLSPQIQPGPASCRPEGSEFLRYQCPRSQR